MKQLLSPNLIICVRVGYKKCLAYVSYHCESDCKCVSMLSHGLQWRFGPKVETLFLTYMLLFFYNRGKPTNFPKSLDGWDCLPLGSYT